jgi:hypothetical protein
LWFGFLCFQVLAIHFFEALLASSIVKLTFKMVGLDYMTIIAPPIRNLSFHHLTIVDLRFITKTIAL